MVLGSIRMAAEMAMMASSGAEWLRWVEMTA